MLISCLCVTHERPEWMPWLLHQFEKQQGLGGVDTELIIIDSSKNPLDFESPNIRVLSSDCAGIAGKRNQALSAMNGQAFAWFDDDDWSAPHRLRRLVDATQEHLVQAAGSRTAKRYSVASGKCASYVSTYEPFIFNGALYDKRVALEKFNRSLVTGEDTDWHMCWLRTRPSYTVIGGADLTAWMCHGKNVSGSNSSVMFDEPNTIPFDEWELDFLEMMRA